MNRNQLIRTILPTTVDIAPQGFSTDTLGNDAFESLADLFFDKILEISKAPLDGITGYGEFTNEGTLNYNTCHDFLTGTFSETEEGYWYNWHEMFDTTCLEENFFNTYYDKMVKLIPYVENQRYLVNNNTFFCYMVTDGATSVGFPDWTRSGVTDHLLDIALMDLNKPYLLIPEKFHSYCRDRGIVIEHFKERFLCMAYFKGIDTLRWHASIDDVVSCRSIMASISSLEERIMALK